MEEKRRGSSPRTAGSVGDDPNPLEELNPSINYSRQPGLSRNGKRLLTCYGQCAGGCDGGDGVDGYTLVHSCILLAGLCDGDELPAIWVGDQVDPVVHLQRFAICSK